MGTDLETLLHEELDAITAYGVARAATLKGKRTPREQAELILMRDRYVAARQAVIVKCLTPSF